MKQSKDAIAKRLKTLYRKIGRAPALFECAEAGITERMLRNHWGGIQRALLDLGMIPMEEPSIKSELELREKLGEIRREKQQLETRIQELLSESATAQALRELIHQSNPKDHNPPDWLIRENRPRGVHGTPVLFLSDIHFDEVVKPEQVNFVNSFNRDIAIRRLKHTFQSMVHLTKHYLKNPAYDGVVCALGGDLLSGNIHEELRDTNEASINLSIMALTDVLIAGLELLLREFPEVFVPCVVGNHGRQSVKPRAKGRVHENFEWLVYEYLRRHFAKEKRIRFMIPEGADCQFPIYGRQFMLTHGDQFHGGTGISGLYMPLLRGMAKKLARNQAMGKPFDVMMCGHWHTYVHTNQLVVNGSVKGVDEYSYQGNFGAEPPQQALWIEHPRNRSTFRMPILCDPGRMFMGKREG